MTPHGAAPCNPGCLDISWVVTIGFGRVAISPTVPPQSCAVDMHAAVSVLALPKEEVGSIPHDGLSSGTGDADIAVPGSAALPLLEEDGAPTFSRIDSGPASSSDAPSAVLSSLPA